MGFHDRFSAAWPAKAAPRGRTGGRGERGGALVAALLFCVLLMGVVIVLFNSSSTASRSAVLQDSNAESAAAAEYAALRAVAEISSWVKEKGAGSPDWVYGKDGDALYVDAAGNQAKDHRRFAGVFGDQEFRVMVRSASLAREAGTKPETWLWQPDPGENVYEITATARNANSTLPAERQTSSSLQMVANINFQDGWSNSIPFPTLFNSLPSNVQFTLGDNILLSGEDHNIDKYYVEKFESERIVTPLKLTAASANFMLAEGSYWNSGQLTLNYRVDPEGPDANPHRPKTTAFGSATENTAMFVPNTSRDYDTYLLGGKAYGSQGRTVTVNMNRSYGGITGVVNETSGSGVSQGGAFDVVLGQFEDLRNLYINMAGVVGSITQPNNWWQMYVGQYTHSRRNSNYSGSALQCYPNYGGERIRAQTLHLMKNKNKQVLVRLYRSNDGKRLYKYPASSTSWTGYYCWADVKISKSGGALLTKTVAASLTTAGEAYNAKVVARTFFWQELVGFQLLRRHEKGISSDPNEPAIITQANLPADGGQKIDKRTIYRTVKETVNGAEIPVRIRAGFDEIYQAHSRAGVPGTAANSLHPLAKSKYGGQVSPGYLQDRFDTIYVWEGGPLESAKAKASMDDFLFDMDFEVEGETITRKALALHIGYEDQRETTADFDYCDMVFTIYIAPSVEQVIKPAAMFPLLTDQWWEQNPDNGLTGKDSHAALATNSDPAAELEGNPFQANFNLLGYSPKGAPGKPLFEDRVYSIGSKTPGVKPNFLRAKFDTNPSTGMPVFTPAKNANGLDIKPGPYYYTEDDINNYLIHDWNAGNEELATEEGRQASRKAFMAMLASLKGNYDFLEMPKRWDPDNWKNGVEITKPVLSGVEEESSYRVMRTSQSVRKIAADIFGYVYQDVPVVKTYEFKPIEESGRPIAPETQSLGFLAGEMKQNPDTSGERLDPLPLEYVKARDLAVDQPDGSTSGLRLFLGETPDEAVKQAYRDFYWNDAAAKTEMQDLYGIKDERFSIGFHRSGPDKRYAERFSQDRYEVALVGQYGFNPFRESKGSMGIRSIAANSATDPEKTGSPDYELSYKYGVEGEDVPDFVFDRLIDGAGILVINGNLVVADVFAYYGVLIVTGDLIVRPTYRPNRILFGDGGNPVDAHGNSLHRDASGNWAYFWKNPVNPDIEVRETSIRLDDKGNPEKGADGQNIPVTPLYATGEDAYAGRLITQGNLLVNGRIITERIPNPYKEGEFITGEIHCFASETANELTNKLSRVFKDKIEITSWTSDSNIALEEDIQKLWSGKN